MLRPRPAVKGERDRVDGAPPSPYLRQMFEPLDLLSAASEAPPAWRALDLMDGARVRICDAFVGRDEAYQALDALLGEVPWETRHIVLFGRSIPQPRLVSWHGDLGAAYTYSGVRNEAAPWTPRLAELRDRVRAALGVPFNSVLCNLYRDGHDSMGLHADDEPELGPEPVIASLSLGATRRFFLVHRRGAKGGPRVNIPLVHGSLLVMAGATQRWYRHGVPKEASASSPAVHQPRINLTFRLIRTT